MGMPVYVIGDREIAEELLNVRGRVSSGRPPNVLGLELCVAMPIRKLIIDKLCIEWAGVNGILRSFRQGSCIQRDGCLYTKLHPAMRSTRIDR